MPSPQHISIDDLIALNDEIAALTRLGVPLQTGITGISGDFAGSLQKITSELQQRIERGEQLDEALQHTAVPDFYRALVQAGLRAGRLSSALEGVSSSLRRVATMRRVINIAFIYPMIIVVTGVSVFVLLSWYWAPAVDELRRVVHLRTDLWVQAMASAGNFVAIWLLALVLLVGVSWYLWSRWTKNALSLVSTTAGRPWFGIPTLAMLRHCGRMATFSELLSLMIRQDVPLQRALPLSAAATGDQVLANAAEQVARDLAAGETLRISQLPPVFPPLVGWLLVGGANQSQLVRGLQHLAAVYSRRAQRQVAWMTLYLPILITAVVGGLIVVLEILAVWLPWLRLLGDLAAPLT